MVLKIHTKFKSVSVIPHHLLPSLLPNHLLLVYFGDQDSAVLYILKPTPHNDKEDHIYHGWMLEVVLKIPSKVFVVMGQVFAACSLTRVCTGLKSTSI